MPLYDRRDTQTYDSNIIYYHHVARIRYRALHITDTKWYQDLDHARGTWVSIKHIYGTVPHPGNNTHSIPYKVEKIDMSKNTQKEDWFLAINPNGRIPALTDKFSDGQTINLFESGSIMQYLVERYDTNNKISYPKGSREWYETNNWLFFQNAGLGPMQGQASK